MRVCDDNEDMDLFRLAAVEGACVPAVRSADGLGRWERGWETLVPYEVVDRRETPSASEPWYGVPQPDALPPAITKESLYSPPFLRFMADIEGERGIGACPGIC